MLGQVLHATLQDLEFTELHNQHQGKGQPLYCQGVFDAITIGEIYMEVLSLCSSVIGTWNGSLNQENLYKSKTWSLFSPFNLHLDQNKTVFVFRGNMYWTVSTDGSVGGPQPLLQRWSHLPTAIEAATFSPLDFKWYFFKGAGLIIVTPLQL